MLATPMLFQFAMAVEYDGYPQGRRLYVSIAMWRRKTKTNGTPIDSGRLHSIVEWILYVSFVVLSKVLG
jgi:hypothetical protein